MQQRMPAKRNMVLILSKLAGAELRRPALDEIRIEAARDEIRLVQNAFVQRNGCVNAFDHEQIERTFHSLNRFGAIPAMRDEFRHE